MECVIPDNELEGAIADNYRLAMLAGWPAGNKGKPVDGRPGFFQTVFLKENIRVVDEWGINSQTNCVHGTVCVWANDQLVWVLRYHGTCKKEASQFLQFVLFEFLKLNDSVGGRGCKYFYDQVVGLTYQNDVVCTGHPLNCRGHETITDEKDNLLEDMEYDSGLLALTVT